MQECSSKDTVVEAVNPAVFAQSIFYLNGKKLKMPKDSMKHLWPIYNRPDSALLLKFGRQTHKSSTVGYNLTLPCLKFENYHALYVAPTGNQVSVFSTDKLDGTINGSPIIKKNYQTTKTKDQVSYKELKQGSKMYLRSSFHSADAIRGISADLTCLDEIQDLISDHIPVIEQCMGHSFAKWADLKKNFDPNLPMHMFNRTIYAGTPKTIENTLERFWNKSTMAEWIIKCTHCNKHNYINEDNVGLTCLICNKCGKPIYYENGQWINMSDTGILTGYRLPQIVLNWVNARENPAVWKKSVADVREKYTTEKFYNEVLALPYANARNPLSPADLMLACKDYSMAQDLTAKVLSQEPLYAGIDWGKGDTASGTSYSQLWIGGHIRGKFKVVYAKKYTGKMSAPLVQIEDMLKIINQFNVYFVLADTGDGRTANAQMVSALGPGRFAEIYEHGTAKKKIRWDGDKGIYIMNRTQMMTDRFMEIKRDQVDFFKADEFEDFKLDFLNIFTEYSEQTRMTKYDHIGADDAFHAYMYCRIACMVMRGEYNKYLHGGFNEEEDEVAIEIG